MNSPKPTRRSILLGAAGLALASTTAQAQPTPVATPTIAFPRTVTHVLGETLIPAQPQRVVAASDFIDLDYLLALGVEPVLYGFTNAWDSGAMPWQGAAADLPSFDTSLEPDLEQVAAARPDLIVAMEMAADVYDQLSAIAPTIVLGWDTELPSGLRLVASALGRDDVAEALLVDVDAQIATAREQLAPVADRQLMVAFAYSDAFYIWGPEAAGSKLFLDLGLNFVGGQEPVLTTASLEQVVLLQDAEMLLSVNSDPDAIAMQEASPLFRNLPAVQNGGYDVLTVVQGRALGDGLSPLSLPWGLPQFVELVHRLANGEGKVLA